MLIPLHPEPQVFHPLGVEHRIFQQIHQHLLNKNGVHGNQQEFLRQGNLDLLAGVVLMEFYQQGIHQFLQHRVLFFQFHISGVNPGDGQQIFHHPHQPLSVGGHPRQHFQVLFPGESVVILHHGGTGAVDGGQGGAQVVGHRPEQIAPHPLGLRLRLHLLLFFQPGGQGSGHGGHNQHHHRRRDALRGNQVEGPIGVGKGVVHRQHADQRRGDAPEIALGPPGHQKHPQHKNHGRQGSGIKQVLQKQNGAEGHQQGHNGKYAVRQGVLGKFHGIEPDSSGCSPRFLPGSGASDRQIPHPSGKNGGKMPAAMVYWGK